MIFFRADANEYIGTGHVMRCLSIAHVLAEYNEKVLFLTADHKSESLIRQNGFHSICLETGYNYMEEEIGGIEALIREFNPKCILVDSYYVTDQYFNKLPKLCKVAYMDDLNDGYRDVDYLINYNIYATVMDYSAYMGSRTQLVLGTKYAPLRMEFQNKGKHTIKDSVNDILVSAGGSDPEQIAERMIKEICPGMPGVRFHFIIGALNPRAETLRKLQRENVIIHVNEKNLSELMMRCDVAVAAAGSTLYELCACGTPTITYTLADNQKSGAEEFGRLGVLLDAGDCRGDNQFIKRLEDMIVDLHVDKIRRHSLSREMQKIVDGLGAERIVEELNK